MHWTVPVESLRPLLPRGLDLDLFQGEAWLGVVPFRMSATRLRFLPPFPFGSSFPELNVRTYVRRGDKPGVWFFSLDAASIVAVRSARRFFYLSYFHARMVARREGEWFCYESRRLDPDAGVAEFRARYRPVGEVQRSTPGSLEHWLTERYCLYAADPIGGLWRGDIHHEPWPLQAAEAEVDVNTMTRPLGFELPRAAPLFHFARRLDVVAWRNQRV